MNRAVLSLFLLGAGLATANIIMMQRPTCPVAGAAVVAAYKETPPAIVGATQGKPAQAQRAQASKPAQAPTANPAQAKPEQTPKAATTHPAAPPKDLDRTGSIDQARKSIGEKSATASHPELAEVRDGQARVEDDEQWAEVSLAARVHSAPSVSSPTIRYYRVGKRLKVIGRQSGWITVVDPATSEKGWIYEKYLTRKRGPSQEQAGVPQQSQKSAQIGSEMPDDPNLMAPARPGSYKKYYEPRRYGWRRAYRYLGAPLGFAIRVYPGW